MKINLPKALKVKNRIAGELARVRELIRRDNSKDVTDASEEVLNKFIQMQNQLLAQEATLIDQLILIKTLVAKANVGIYEKISRMNELKSQIAFIRTLPTRMGTFDESAVYGGLPLRKIYHAVVNQNLIDGANKDFQRMIDQLQDEIDDFNASTFIELPDVKPEEKK